MHAFKRSLIVTAVLFAMAWPGARTSAWAGEVKVAIAANFTAAAKEIASVFEKATGHKAVMSFGSTGKLYTQIIQGAPFEVFLAADARRPEKLEKEGGAVRGTRFTYAVGKLVLWSATPGISDIGPDVLKMGKFQKLAIANPKTAPYGAAATEVLKALRVHDALAPKLVRGDSISQTYQFAATGNAQFAFVALAQIALKDTGSKWVVSDDLYSPIRQQAQLLNKGADSEAAKAYLAFLKGPEAAEIIHKYGYGTE